MKDPPRSSKPSPGVQGAVTYTKGLQWGTTNPEEEFPDGRLVEDRTE